MQAKDVMTTAVVSLSRDSTIDEAVHLMIEHRVSALPVTDAEGRPVGLISEGDLMRRLHQSHGQRRSWWLEMLTMSNKLVDDFVMTRSRHVSDVMTTPVETVEEATPIAAIARLLEEKHIKRVPVLRGGKVVGIVSRANLLHVLAHPADTVPSGTSSPDGDLQARIRSAMAEVPGVQPNFVNLHVKDGKVLIWGFSDSEAVEKALRVAAENVAGVRSVEVVMERPPAWVYGG